MSGRWCVLATYPHYLTTLAGNTATTVNAPVQSTDPAAFSSLRAVACRAVGHCTAVGTSYEGPWDQPAGYRDELVRGTWHAQPGTPAADHIACNQARCVAAGTADIGVLQANIDDRLGDGAWVTRAIVTPWQDASDHGNLRARIGDVTCVPGNGSCYGTGSAQPDFTSNSRPLFFFRAGRLWKGVPQALPAGADPTASGGVTRLSCPTEGNCTGLGTYVDSDGTTHLFAESLTDGVLSAAAVPTPPLWSRPRVSTEVVSTDCPAVGECVAAADGYFRVTSTLQTALLRLHDGSWSYDLAGKPANASPGTGPFVADLSCATATACLAVGGYQVGRPGASTYRAAGWQLTDRGWVVRRFAAPAGVTLDPGSRSTVDAVECSGTNRCVVAGTSGGTAVYATVTISS